MAKDDKPTGPDADADLAPEARLEKMLAARWDPAKLSKFLKSSGRGTALDASHRGRFEKRLGVDLGNVRIFTGELAEEITAAHGAEALTVGDTGMIVMRQSAKFAPGSAAYTSLLAHELTHVAQAKPDALSRKATSAQQSQVDSSEQEAQQQEAEVLAEELGLNSLLPTDADKGEKKKSKREKLTERVMQIMQDEQYLEDLRSGADNL
jgi:hypothetical protein